MKRKPKAQNTKVICPCGCGKELRDHELFVGGCLKWATENRASMIDHMKKIADLTQKCACIQCDHRENCPYYGS